MCILWQIQTAVKERKYNIIIIGKQLKKKLNFSISFKGPLGFTNMGFDKVIAKHINLIYGILRFQLASLSDCKKKKWQVN